MANVVVIGGGFGGLKTAKALNATLITNKRKFVFVPRTPELLSGRKKGVAVDIKSCHENTVFGTATKVDPKKQLVHVGKKKVPYDYLIVATGARSAAPVPGVRTYAKFFYTYEDAKAIKKLLPRKHVVIIGAGPTGVEVAAEIAPESKVTIIQNSPSILPLFTKKAQDYATMCLEKRGVDIRCSETVERITASGVHTSKGKISADLIIWAAGLRANLIEGLPAERGHTVNEFLQVQGFDNIFAIGDCASSGSPLTAQAAIAEAKSVIKNVRRAINGSDLVPFKYKHKGSFLILRDCAFAESFINVYGKFALWLRELYYHHIMRSYQ